MTLKEFSQVLRRCKATPRLRYVQPTIHARTHDITTVTFFMSDGEVELTITNNPDEDFVLAEAVNAFLDAKEAE